MNRNELVSTLELVKLALAKDNLIPICQCFVFQNGKVSAYDNSIAIVGPANFDRAFGVHGNTALGLISGASSEEVDAKFEENSVTFKLGKTTVDLPTSSEDDFLFTEPDTEFTKIPLTVGLCEAIKLCLKTVSSDETQQALKGIHIQGDKMYSSDSDMLTQVQLKKPIKQMLMLPTAFCNAVVKIWDDRGMAKGTLGFNDEWLCAEFEDWAVYGRVPELNQQLDFAALVQKKLKGTPDRLPVPEGFADALARARVLADPESKQTAIKIAKGKMHLVTSTHMGTVNDVLTFKDHPDVEANVTASHLQQAVAVCDTIAFHTDHVVLEKSPDVLMLVSNLA